MSAVAGLGPRQAAVLAHLEEHPGLTAGELARAFGLRHSLLSLLRGLEQRARVTAVSAWAPAQGRQVARWHAAPPGTVPPPRPAPDPAAARAARERETAAQRARRARRNPPRHTALRVAPLVLDGAACKGADLDLFFGPFAEFVSSRQQREAKATAICAGCPVKAECLEYALDAREVYGVWGGMTEDERRALLRRRRAS